MNLQFLLAFLLFALALDCTFFIAAGVAIRRWGGRWRVSAIVSVALVVLAVSWLGWQVLKPNAGATSHNLWPFELFFINVAGLVLLGMLHVSRVAATRFVARSARPN